MFQDKLRNQKAFQSNWILFFLWLRPATNSWRWRGPLDPAYNEILQTKETLIDFYFLLHLYTDKIKRIDFILGCLWVIKHQNHTGHKSYVDFDEKKDLFGMSRWYIDYWLSDEFELEIPKLAKPSCKGSELSQAELGHLNFWAENELSIIFWCMSF